MKEWCVTYHKERADIFPAWNIVLNLLQNRYELDIRFNSNNISLKGNKNIRFNFIDPLVLNLVEWLKEVGTDQCQT